MAGNGLGASRRFHGWAAVRRVLSVLVTIVMLVDVGGQSAQASPIASTALTGSVATPGQRSGSAAGLPHQTGSAIGKSTSGAPLVTPRGAAAETKTPTPQVTPHLSNVEQQGVASPAGVRERSGPPVTTGRELPDKRTATMSLFANPDGTQTAKVYPRPVHYRDSTGAWADIDTTLTPGATGVWAEKADSSSASFAATAGDPSLVSVPTGPGQSIAFAVQGAANSTGVSSGSSITYRGVLADSDVTELATAGGGVKETLTLHGADAPATWVFPLTLHGLTASMAPDGSVVFTNGVGQVVATIAHGFMRDSRIDPASGDGVLSTGVTYALTTVAGQQALQVTLDSAWLHDPARVFPVTVDPSIANVNTSGSTYVQSPFNNDFSGSNELDVGTFNGGGNVSNSYLKFDVSSLTNDYIEAATLNLDEIWSFSCSPRPVFVSPIFSGWAVGGLKTFPWVSYGAPIGQSNVAAGFSSACPGPAWQSIDIGDNPSAAGTKLIESWTHGAPNNGLAVTADPRDSFGWKKFDSLNSPFPPFLSITFSPFGAAYSFPGPYVHPTGTSSGSQQVTITNLGNSTWTPGNQQLWYQLYDTSFHNLGINGSVDPPTALPQSVAPNQTITMTGNIGPVTPGQYILCWDMFDHSTSFNLTYGVDSPCETIDSANTPPQIDTTNPPSNVTLGSLTPEFSATGHDPDNFPGQGLTYDFQVYSEPADGSAPTLVVDSGLQSSATYRVPSGKLSWNQSYSWIVSNNDTLGSSAWSNPSFFTTTVPQPLITSHLGVNTSEAHFDPGVGDYTTTATDASVATAGPKLEITRSYNSLDPRTGGLFGAGWSTVYDMTATPDGDGSGNVVVTYPDGHTVRFGSNPDGTFTPPQGMFATLTAVSGGGYRLTDRGGTTYTFGQTAGAGWALTSITDAAGRSQTLAYDGSGHLATVTSTAGGRTLHFTFTGAHVSTVTTDAITPGGALTWTYKYTGDALTSVCPPTSPTNCTTYGYTSGPGEGSHYRTAVLDAGPQAYWRLGDASGSTTAVDEVGPNLGTLNGVYSTPNFGHGPGPLPGSPATSSFFGGGGGVALPDHLVSQATYLSVQLWFQGTGTGPLFSTGHSAIGDPNPDPGAMPVLYVGSDGKLYGQFWTGSVAPIVSASPVNDNNWHQVTLVGEGATQSMYLDGQLVGTQSGQLFNADPKDFVGDGYVNGNGWANLPGNAFDFYTGNIAEVAFYTHPLGATAIAAQYDLGSHPAAELTGITTPNGNTAAQASYNNVTDRATQVSDDHGGQWNLTAPATGGSSAQYRGAVAATGPVDFWPLGDTGAQAVNLVPPGSQVRGSDGDGNYSNVTLGQPGPFTGTGETAAGFNGTSSKLTLPATSTTWGTPGKAVGLWFQTSTPGAVLLEYGGLPLVYVGANGEIYGCYGNGCVNSVIPVTDGKWHFAALAFTLQPDGALDITVYVDGVMVGSETSPIINGQAATTLTVGAGPIAAPFPSPPANNPNGFFTGSIADVTLYGTSYDPTTIQSAVTTLFNAAHTASSSPTPITTATVTDPGSKTLSYQYDPAGGGRLVSFTDGLGHTTRYTYDTNGFGHTTVFPDGNYLITTQDARGNILSRTTGDPSGTTATSYDTYPAAGAFPVTDPRNDEPLTTLSPDSSGPSDTTFQTSYTYDAAGNLLTMANPVGAETINTYTTGTEPAVGGGTEPPGLLATQKDPVGNTTAYAYNAAGDQATITAPSGLRTSNSFDQVGRKLSQTQTSDTFPAGVVTTYAWDGQNRLQTQTGPAATDAVTGKVHTPQTSYTYDLDGNLHIQTVADTTGGDATRTTTNTYNTHDELATTTDPANRKTSYGYDGYGNRTSSTDPAGSTYAYGFDANHHETSTTLTNWTGNPNNPIPATNLVLDSRAYDPDGFLASDTDSMGRTTTNTYDFNGRLVASDVTNYHTPTGTTETVHVATNAYDPAGNRTSQFDLSTQAAATTNTFDPAGRILTSTQPNGRVTTLTYDGDNHVKTSTVTNGTVTEETDNTYNSLGNITSQVVHDGSTNLTTTATYDQRGAQTSVVDPRGNATGGTPANYTSTFTNDPAGRLTMVTGATVNTETNGGTPTAVHPITEYGYDTFGDQTSVSDPDGNITSNTYNADGELLGVSQPAYTPPGTSTPITPLTQYTYTLLGDLATTTDPRTNVTTNTYDQLGNLVTVTQPPVGGQTPISRYTYDTDGEQLSATDPTGAQTQATYDDLGQQLTATSIVRQPSTQADTTIFGYDPTQASGNDPLDQPLSETQPGGQKTSHTYDTVGDLASTTDPLTHTTGYTYDADGHLTKTTLPDGSATTTSYDPAGRATGTAQLDATGTTLFTTATGYDPAGNKTSVTNANTITTSYIYDAGNRLTQQVQPTTATANITTSYGYDAAGQNTRFTDGNGNRTIYTFNTLALPESTIVPSVPGYTTPADSTTTAAYDANGNPTGLTKPGGVTQTLTYDPLNRPIAETGTGAQAPTTTRNLGYDLAGRITSISTPTGNDTLTYDDRGNVLTANGPSGTTNDSYNSNGQLASRADAAGTATFTYNDDGKLATLADPLTGSTAHYTYNSLDQVTGVNYGTNTANLAYGYDPAHRLASQTLTAPGGAAEASVGYGYDPVGNVTSKTTSGTAGAAANTYTYDQANRLMSWKSGTATTNYGYDGAGNRTQNGAATATYNARDQLVSTTTGATTTSYAYTARGTLSSQTTGSATTSYADDAFDHLAIVTTGAGTTNYTYDALGRLLTAGTASFRYDGTATQPVSDGTDTLTRDPNGNPVSQVAGGNAALLFTDQHGDITGSYTPTGTTLTGSTAYDPFGQPTATAGARSDFGYQGGWTDPVTGDTATDTRWYDPTTGDFTSHDTFPITPDEAATATNPYAYANNNPSTNNDPTGRSVATVIGDIETFIEDAAEFAEDENPIGGLYQLWRALGSFFNGQLEPDDCSRPGSCTLPGQPPAPWRPPAPGRGPGPAPRGTPHSGSPFSGSGSRGRGTPPVVRRTPAPPPPPTMAQIIAARVYQTPINPRPNGQVHLPGEILQPGTKTPETGPSDEPINTTTIGTPNPSETATPFNPHAQPGSPETWIGGISPAQAQLSNAPCSGGTWTFNGEDWSQTSVVCDALHAAAAPSLDIRRITPDPTFRTDSKLLYRLENRAPDDVFENGFVPWDVINGQYDLRSYVDVNQPSPFVSTTYRNDMHTEWNKRYQYVINATGGIIINSTIGTHQYARQEEVAFPGGIDRRFIVGVQEVSSDKTRLGPLISNPYYDPLEP